MKFSLIILSVIVATVSAGVVQSSRNPLIELPKYSIQPHLSGEGRITNGKIATPGQFPYQVIMLLQIGAYIAFCGGTLISDRYVVTAAHCLDEASEVHVLLGRHNFKEEEETEQRFLVKEKDFIIHERWNRNNLQNDIALLRLNGSVIYNAFVQPATLPNKNNVSNYVDDEVIASGWGRYSDNVTSLSSELRFIEVEVLKNLICKIYYPGIITDDMMGVSTKGYKSTCNGDSGGPLVHKENGKNILVGITSFGIHFGCEKLWPAMFTRVTSYLDWIKKHSGVVNNA